MHHILRAAILGCGLLLARQAMAATLFDDLGQGPGVARIVDEAFAAWQADPRISRTFENSNPERTKRMLKEQFCQLTGGGCSYHGRNMREAHEALNLDNRQFNALVEGLQHAMDDQDVSFRTQNRLLALLAPMQRDVVTR